MEEGYTTTDLIIEIAMITIMGGFLYVALHFIIKFW